MTFRANAAPASISLFLVFLTETMALLRQQIIDAEVCLATSSILLWILVQVIGLQAEVNQGVIETYMLWHLIIAVLNYNFDITLLVVLISLRLQLLQFFELRLECAQSLHLLLFFLIVPLLQQMPFSSHLFLFILVHLALELVRFFIASNRLQNLRYNARFNNVYFTLILAEHRLCYFTIFQFCCAGHS